MHLPPKENVCREHFHYFLNCALEEQQYFFPFFSVFAFEMFLSLAFPPLILYSPVRGNEGRCATMTWTHVRLYFPKTGVLSADAINWKISLVSS